jgi:hypothetical protein
VKTRVKSVKYLTPYDLLGKEIRIYLKDGGEFYFKVQESHIEGLNDEFAESAISGFDDEGQYLKIDFEDIEFILGGH